VTDIENGELFHGLLISYAIEVLLTKPSPFKF